MPEPQSADDLHALDPKEFTAARNALAKRLKEARSFAAVRGPSLTAWALNQVARLVEDVLDAGSQLKDAMSQAFARDRSGFAEAQEAERAAIEAGAEAAVRCLEEAGHPPGDEARRKITETLRSVATDEATAELLQRGALDADKASTGFGFGAISSLGQETEGLEKQQCPRCQSGTRGSTARASASRVEDRDRAAARSSAGSASSR